MKLQNMNRQRQYRGGAQQAGRGGKSIHISPKSNISLTFDSRKLIELPTSNGYATITINATAHHDAADILVHASTPTLTVLTER